MNAPTPANTNIYYISRSVDSKVSDSFKKYGICSTCSQFTCKLYKHGKEKAQCSRIYSRPVPLSSYDPIVDCIDYHNRIQLTLPEMEQIATIINVRRKAGFIEEVEVEFKSPEKNVETQKCEN